MDITEQSVKTLAPLIRARLRGLMEREGLRMTDVMKRLDGNNHPVHLETVKRWLSGYTEMSLEQVDWMLGAIGVDRQAIMWPVITGADRAALAVIAKGGRAKVASHRKVRMAAEGMLLVRDGQCKLTRAGEAYLGIQNEG